MWHKCVRIYNFSSANKLKQLNKTAAKVTNIQEVKLVGWQWHCSKRNYYIVVSVVKVNDDNHEDNFGLMHPEAEKWLEFEMNLTAYISFLNQAFVLLL